MIESTDPREYTAPVITDPSDCEQVRFAGRNYRIMLLSILGAILDRYERDPEYPFIDTKLRVADGRDFDPSDPLRGKNAIYPWIQGRGLEALACHDLWIRRSRRISPDIKDELSHRIRSLLAEVVDGMERLRSAAGGRLSFIMDRKGHPLEIRPDGQVAERPPSPDAPANFAELFYAKGLAATGPLLGDERRLSQACERFQLIERDIRSGRFRSDQIPLDPQNRALRAREDRCTHAPWMIGVGAASCFLQTTGREEYAEVGMSCIEHVLERYVDLGGRSGPTRKYDMWEFVDSDGAVLIEDDGAIVSDPGHAVEFVGLSLEFLRACEGSTSSNPARGRRIDELRSILPRVLERNFRNGFSPPGPGIVKHVDLLSRRILHPDTPWWSLPEAMRAGVEACNVVRPERREGFARLAAESSNAFVRNYVRPECHLMGVQVLRSDGSVATSVPACPDADPAYHTGLPVIDALQLLESK